MTTVEYRQLDAEQIDEIRGLWERLNAHHADVSSHFAERFKGYSFGERKQALLDRTDGGKMCILVARDSAEARDVGYCISTLKKNGQGEIDSLFLEQGHRGTGIGESLMEQSLEWLDSCGAREKILYVVSGNERVHGFYERYGFVSHCTVLLQKDE